MPPRPKRPCNKPGCKELTTERFCEAHKKQDHRNYNQQRGTTEQQGYGKTWRKVRQQVLNHEPLCRRCVADGVIKQADLVHHVDRNPWNNDISNLEPLCVAHHNAEHGSERSRPGGV